MYGGYVGEGGPFYYYLANVAQPFLIFVVFGWCVHMEMTEMCSGRLLVLRIVSPASQPASQQPFQPHNKPTSQPAYQFRCESILRINDASKPTETEAETLIH